MDYEELIIFKKNVNEIICLKSFFQTTMIKQAAGYFFSNKDNYKALFIIDFKYSNNYELDCFDISKLSLYKGEKEVLFKIFSFFKIISVDIEKNDKKAEIKLASIGREENFESILNLLDRGKIQFNISKKI